MECWKDTYGENNICSARVSVEFPQTVSNIEFDESLHSKDFGENPGVVGNIFAEI